MGGLLASLIFIPQIWKMIITKSSKDLSYTTLFVSNMSSAFLIVYSIQNNIKPMIVTTVISLVTRILIVFLKLYLDTRFFIFLHEEPNTSLNNIPVGFFFFTHRQQKHSNKSQENPDTVQYEF